MAGVARAILRRMRTGLLVTAMLVGPWPAEAKESGIERCVDKTLTGAEGGDDVDLEVTGPCEVRAGAYAFRNVSILSGGSLTFLDVQTEFTVHSIVIDGGSLIAGTTAAPIGKAGQLLVTFVDSPANPCDSVKCPKGILVRARGTLRLVGARGVPESGVSWTHLSTPAGPPMRTAPARARRPRWPRRRHGHPAGQGRHARPRRAGVTATGSPSPRPASVRSRRSSSRSPGRHADGWEAPTSRPPRRSSKYYHFGGARSRRARPRTTSPGRTKTTNYGVDERAEVGLITRNIKLTAAVDAAACPTGAARSRSSRGSRRSSLQGVEIEKFGKARLGSYPIHLHVAGDGRASTLIINANSMHHSFNKCITIHSTSNVTVQNNVCARIVGHIFYQEIGDEADIMFGATSGSAP